MFEESVFHFKDDQGNDDKCPLPSLRVVEATMAYVAVPVTTLTASASPDGAAETETGNLAAAFAVFV